MSILGNLVLIGYIFNKEPPPFAAYLLIKGVNSLKGNSQRGKACDLTQVCRDGHLMDWTVAQPKMHILGVFISTKCYPSHQHTSLPAVHLLSYLFSTPCIYHIQSSCLLHLKPLWIKCKFH